MFLEEDGPGEAAIGFTDQFVDAGIAKLDAVFGAGYAKANPQALAGYLAACASNLNAFMTAATMIPGDLDFDEDALAMLEEEVRPAPGRKPKKRGR